MQLLASTCPSRLWRILRVMHGVAEAMELNHEHELEQVRDAAWADALAGKHLSLPPCLAPEACGLPSAHHLNCELVLFVVSHELQHHLLVHGLQVRAAPLRSSWPALTYPLG